MRAKVLGALICALCASTVMAGPVVTGFTGGSSYGIFYGDSTGDVVGFRFTADYPLKVSDLGILEDPADGVLDSSHEVGIWRNSDQMLLASTTVSESDTHMGGFVYAPITPIVLAAGEQYTLGAMYTAFDNDSYISSPSSVTLDMISGTNGVYPSTGSLGFVYPELDSTNLARFGPNAIATIIPEPATLALVLFGGLALVRRR